MIRKWLAFGIILLFLGVIIAPAIAQNTEKSQSSRGNWLYVGGSGPGNYTKIQDAIDNASDGDTVFVYDDSSPYYENIIIDKSITLRGENRDTTILRGNNQNETILLNADNAIISKMTITIKQNVYIRNIRIEGDNNKIIENKFINGTGIDFYHKGQNSNVENNLFYGLRSIHISNTKEIIIRNNTMINSEWCIMLDAVTYCAIENNNMSGGEFSVVQVQGQSNNIIHNAIRLNVTTYDYAYTGLELFDSYNNVVRDNNLIKCGIMLANHPGGDISNNTVNGKPFVYLRDKQDIIVDNAGQVWLEDCKNITVRNLTISNITTGIHLFNVNNSHIEQNTISKCINGIAGRSYNCDFVDNTLSSCNYGMDIYGNSNNIRNNQFTNCSIYGILAIGIVDIQNNSFSLCLIGLCFGLGTCSYNKIDNCSTGIKCSGYTPLRITYNSIQFCSIGIFAGTYGFKSLKVNRLSEMIVPIPWYLKREISYNNIINSSTGATFANARFTHWIKNYWGEPFEKPKIIHGYLRFDPYGSPRIKWINIDWRPAQEPYDIPEMS